MSVIPDNGKERSHDLQFRSGFQRYERWLQARSSRDTRSIATRRWARAGDLNVLLYTSCDEIIGPPGGNFRPKTVPVGRKRNLRSRRCDRPDLAEFRGVTSLSIDLLRRRVHEVHADGYSVTGREATGFSLPHRTGPVAHFRKRAGGCVERCERRDICPRVKGRSAGSGIGHTHKL